MRWILGIDLLRTEVRQISRCFALRKMRCEGASHSIPIPNRPVAGSSIVISIPKASLLSLWCIRGLYPRLRIYDATSATNGSSTRVFDLYLGLSLGDKRSRLFSAKSREPLLTLRA